MGLWQLLGNGEIRVHKVEGIKVPCRIHRLERYGRRGGYNLVDHQEDRTE